MAPSAVIAEYQLGLNNTKEVLVQPDNLERPLLPTDPYMTCSWGDNLNNKPNGEPLNFTHYHREENGAHKIYRVPYQYGSQGEYNITCTMWNKVSTMTLDKNVSLGFMADFRA